MSTEAKFEAISMKK